MNILRRIARKLKEAIMDLFKVDGTLSIDTSNVYIDGQKTDLSVCKISEEDYHKLVVDNNCISNMIYVVSSDNINAYGSKIVNVAQPTAADDAATKKYVDEYCSQLVHDAFDVPRRLSELDNDMQYVTREEAYEMTKTVLRSTLQSMLSGLGN